jgi:hypothetical protein
MLAIGLVLLGSLGGFALGFLLGASAFFVGF